MSPKTKRGGLTSFVAGLVVGAGMVWLRNSRARKAPHALPDQKRISRSLSRTLAAARREAVIPLLPGHRYVIFSDHHKGAGDDADDFRPCKATYLHALNEYHLLDYSLVLLGDAEELWENDPHEVFESYPDVFEAEARFFPLRYLRVVGNHDDAWYSEANVHRYLQPILPGVRVYHSLIFQYVDGPQTSGEVFLAHGHQGTLDAETFRFIPPLVLPLYRQIQNLSGIGHTSPSQDECLRSEHDTMMYRWASRQGKLLLIAGHTHRPVWSSRTHLEKLLWQYTGLLQLKPEQRPADYEQQLEGLRQEIAEREAKFPPCSDTLKTRPCYFNTGCCRFEDGDITGIELENGELRLVKWGKKAGVIQRSELEKAPIAEVFALL